MKLKLLILTLITPFFIVFAQKSAPVAGDAAQLIDLLKKDYNAINQDNKGEDLYRDRAKAISIFKSYLKRNYDTGFALASNNLNASTLNTIKSDEIELENLEQELSSLIEKNPKESSRTRDINDTRIEEIKNSLSVIKKRIITNQWQIQNKELNNLKTLYEDNPYIKSVITIFINKYEDIDSSKVDLFSETNYSSSIQKSLPFLGGDLAFETLIDGLSRFLAKRIKAELTNYVMENIKDKLENPSAESYINELLVLLPKTTNYIKQFNADEILSFTDVIKQHIETDLNDLLTNAVNLKSTPRFRKLIKDKPSLEFAFEALQIIPQLSKVKHPIDYFDLLENTELVRDWSADNTKKVKYNIANTIKLASLLAHSMIVLDNDEVKFASTSFMTNYGSEPEFLLLYFGFLNQQNLKYYNVKFHKAGGELPVDFKTFMDSIKPEKVLKGDESIKKIQKSISLITDNAEKLYQDALVLKKASKNADEKIEFTDVHTFVESFTSFFEQAITTSELLIKEGKSYGLVDTTIDLKIRDNLMPYINTTKSANNMVLQIHQKKYSTALITALEIPSNFNANVAENNTLNFAINALKNSEQILRIKTLTSDYKSLPKKQEKINAVLELLENIYANSTDNNLQLLINNVIITVEKKEIEAYSTNLQSLIGQIKNEIINDKLFQDFTGIAKDKLISKMTAKINDDIVKDKLERHLDSYIKTYFLKTVDSSGESETKFQSAQDNLNRTLRIYFPNIVADTFRITDKNVIKIIHFVNDVALSETAEDVEQALDAFALPTGSYTVKRNAISNVSINSYPGILGGIEFSKYNNQKGEGAIGFTAPVGISFNTPIRNVNAFIPIIDIAAPVRLRLDGESETKTLPEFNFKNILTPGFYLSYPLKNTPFAFNLGAQYGPELNFEDEDSDGNPLANFNKDTFSINLGIVIDIPLFTIYNKPRSE